MNLTEVEHTFLYFGEDSNDGHDNTQKEVGTDEKLVKTAGIGSLKKDLNTTSDYTLKL